MAKFAEIPQIGDGKDPGRIATFGRKVGMVINSLLRKGLIVRDGTDSFTFSLPGGNGTVTSISNGTGLVSSTNGPITSNGTLSIGNTGVTPGNYSLANFTVNGQGQLTAASNGTLPAANYPVTTKGDLFGFGNAAARLPVGNDGQIPYACSSVALGIAWGNAPSGGGGNGAVTVSDGTNTVANATTLNFTGAAVTGTTPTANIAISGGGGNGSINGWESPFTKPTVAATTFVNATGFTKTDDTNGLFLVNTGLSASDNLCLGHLAVPVSGAWAVTVRVQSLWGDSGFACGGAHLYESTTGRVIVFGNQATSGGQRLCVNYFNSVTSFNSEPKTVPCTERATWLRISYNGTSTFTFAWSMDGYSWVDFVSFSSTAFFLLGASHAGFFLDPNDSNIVTAVKCMSLTVQ